MRLWSLHPKYLDQKGLVALWRESLLCQAVLLGETKGYKNHPQLVRFKQFNKNEQIDLISQYLKDIWAEADKRGYDFNYTKIYKISTYCPLIKVTTDQLKYEFEHLQKKLLLRDKEKMDNNFQRVSSTRKPFKINSYEGSVSFSGFTSAIYRTMSKNIESHPLFKVVEGDIEPWEKIK